MRKLLIPGYCGPILVPKRPSIWRRLFGSKVSPLTTYLIETLAKSHNVIPPEMASRILNAFLSENVNSAPTIPLLDSDFGSSPIPCSIEELFISFDTICAFHAQSQITGEEASNRWRCAAAIEQYLCWCFLRTKLLAHGAPAIGWLSWRYASALYITVNRDKCEQQLKFVPIWRNGVLLREMNYLFQQLGDQTAIPLVAHSALYREPFRQEALKTIVAIIKQQPPELRSHARDQAVNTWAIEEVLEFYGEQVSPKSINKCIHDLDALLA